MRGFRAIRGSGHFGEDAGGRARAGAALPRRRPAAQSPAGRATSPSPRRTKTPHEEERDERDLSQVSEPPGLHKITTSAEDEDEQRLISWGELRPTLNLDERRVTAYQRMIEAQQLVYKLWERRSSGMNWVGEVVGEPIPERDDL